MQTWKLEIEYEGTRYGGWQKQSNNRTVQGELQKAAEAVLNTQADIGGSGRTDAGVHALFQVAHLRAKPSNKALTSKQFRIELNNHLPHDINVLNVYPAASSFHARHDAISRYYIYQISTRRSAFSKPLVWWIRDRLNVEAMTEASNLLLGKNNFVSFSENNGASHTSTVVHVSEAVLFTSGSLILFRIGASHFLWKMVRRIVGALAEVGRGKLKVEGFKRLLESRSNEPAAWTAPPSGLFLEKVLYAGDNPPKHYIPPFPVE